MASVLIIDDHPIVLQGCRRILQDAGVATILEARDLVGGYRLYRRHRPDAVIVDLELHARGLGGLTLIQRIHAQLFHQGAPPQPGLLTSQGRICLNQSELSPAGHQVIEVALRMIDTIGAELDPLRAELARLARRQPGCRALMAHYGVGTVTAVAIWAELGDCRRFSSSDDTVRHTGLDVTVHSSDGKRTRGHLARQGPPVLRWALFEAAKCAARHRSPDHDYYLEVRDRLGANRATLSVARKLARRCHHTLRALGDDAFAAVS